MESYIKANIINTSRHPEDPLTIYKYSKTMIFEGLWDHVTMTHRGLIKDDDGNIVGRPFDKFFNYNEPNGVLFYGERYDIFNKYDGSLIIIYYYNDNWHIASSGSFTSDVKLLALTYINRYDFTYLNPDYTYMAEFIGPDNRIVINYDESELILIGSRNTKTGEYDMDLTKYESVGWKVSKPIGTIVINSISDLNELKENIPIQKEGYVLFNEKYQHFTKVKGSWYIDLHKTLTRISTKDIWHALYTDTFEEFSMLLADDMKHIVNEYAKIHIIDRYHDIMNNISGISKQLISLTPHERYQSIVRIVHERELPKIWIHLISDYCNGKQWRVDDIIFRRILKPKFEILWRL